MKRLTDFLMLSLIVMVGLASCEKKPRGETLRPEYISVYEKSPDMTVDEIQVPFSGAQDAEIHVVSDLDLQWRYLADPAMEDPQWLTVKTVEEVEKGHWIVKYDAKSILENNSLGRRTGKLSFSNAEAFMGKFINIRQGYVEEYADDFADRDIGALVLSGKEVFTTDTLKIVNKDYYNYVSFNAYAYRSDNESMENVKLNVTVEGGPSFKEIDRETYTVSVPLGFAPAASNLRYMLMWNDGKVMGSKVRLKFSVDNPDGTEVMIDNLHIYKVSEAELDNIVDDEEYEDELEEWV